MDIKINLGEECIVYKRFLEVMDDLLLGNK